MDLTDLIDYCKAQAIANALEPTQDSIWRQMARSYSKTFSTPLHEVMELDPEMVILSHFENQMDSIKDVEERLEEFLDTIYGIEDPEYQKQKESELNDFIKQSEQEEEGRVEKGKPIHPAMKNDSTLAPPEVKKLPVSGGINASYFNEENER